MAGSLEVRSATLVMSTLLTRVMERQPRSIPTLLTRAMDRQPRPIPMAIDSIYSWYGITFPCQFAENVLQGCYSWGANS